MCTQETPEAVEQLIRLGHVKEFRIKVVKL